jgi:uncharacterized protein (DUF952 family)
VILKNLVFHIADRKAWEKGRQLGKYSSESLEQKGFIDCLTKDKILQKANKKFLNKKDLLLLYIDTTLVGTEIKSTNIYGPLDTDAVIRIVTLNPQEDGTFLLPPDLV